MSKSVTTNNPPAVCFAYLYVEFSKLRDEGCVNWGRASSLILEIQHNFVRYFFFGPLCSVRGWFGLKLDHP